MMLSSDKEHLWTRVVGMSSKLDWDWERRCCCAAEYVAAQSQPLIQKKIPSSGETIPIIGLGTARRYEEVKNDARKCRCAKPSPIPSAGREGHRFLSVLRHRGSGGR